MKKFVILILSMWSLAFGQNFGSSLPGFLAEAETNTQVRLIADAENFVPGETLMVGLVMEMNDHWHTYWSNPGDAGMPTMVSLDLPDGFTQGEILWPAPERFVVEGLVSLGYEEKVILRMMIETPADFPLGETLAITGEATWLECKEACIPGSGDVSLNLLAAEDAGEANPEFLEGIEKLYRETDWVGSFEENGDQVVLRVNAAETDGPFVHFFPFEEGAWMLEPEPVIEKTADGIEIRLTRNPAAIDPEAVPEGLLVNEKGWGFSINTLSSASEEVAAVPSADVQAAPTYHFLPVLLMAFFGGVILNLLPCVFPVLGLKVSGFLEQAHGDLKQAKLHSLVFSLGILVSLWILAGIVSSLNLAWGGQLGDPTTVIVLILLLSLFTLNLFGVFEIGYFFTRLGGGASQKKGYAGSFFSGTLVTVIATPCTAPFMGGAISWALTQPAILAFIVFTALGLGIAAPYVILSFSPKLMGKMPRPGAWMETFKQGSAFFMLAFVWVLFWVLSELVPVAVLNRVLGAVCLMTLAAWILGKWGAIHRSKKSKRIGKLLGVVLIVLAFMLSFSYQAPIDELNPELQARIDAADPIMYHELEPELVEKLQAEEVPVHWTPFTPEKLDALLAAQKPVFIDFTAKWCLTCQANKRSSLYKPEVLRALQDAGVITLAADLTKDDPILKEALASYGRRGVPTYIVYNQQGEWTLLSETLTPGLVTGSIQK
ncbi:protein-disulfide reductase DsbD family protein [Kiritimatiellaeota bacterium B1221]|nr:protein-disulfide reductase DsbD family protein [Kiritimatiellaeota bacterium B1221]